MIAIIIQARMGSTRLPGKVLKDINGKCILEILLNRIKKSKKISKIIIATTNLKKDIDIVKFSKSNKIDYFCGSKNNLIKRYLDTSKKFNIDHIVRLTADCPLIDPQILDKLIDIYFEKNLDYCSNTCPPHLSKFPDGSDIEIFSFNALKKISKLRLEKDYKEHLTKFFWKHNKFKKFIMNNKKNLSNFKYSVDTMDDFKKIERLIKYFKNKIYTITTDQIISYLKNDTQK